MVSPTPEQIDELLPQTQCGLCGFGGCLPYAENLIFQGAPINLCPPGGIEVLERLGAALQIDSAPYRADMLTNIKAPVLAFIREAECIGCTKCIKACPVDSIIGAAKLMHTIIEKECTGCELCVSACPVDCIDLVADNAPRTEARKKQFREHTLRKSKRLTAIKSEKDRMTKMKNKHKLLDYIQSAIERAKMKHKK